MSFQFLQCVARTTVLAAALVFGTAAMADEGRFVFADLLTDDPEVSRTFYSGLFGWRFKVRSDPPVREAILSRGREIGVMFPVENRRRKTSESQWVSVLVVASADTAAKAARRAGGQIKVGPASDKKGGRYAVLRDPQGALLAVYSGDGLPGVATGAGRWRWFDLFTTNVGAAGRFYGKIAGLKSVRDPDAGPRHRVLKRDGKARAGMISIAGKSVKPAWLPYVKVRNLRRTLARAHKLGGKIVARNDEAAIIIDPAGAAIGVQATGSGAGS